MDLALFLRGMLLGFSIAAPVGPIGLLCIRRTLTDGRLIGLASGLGVATADLLYGSLAAFGLTAATSLLTGNATWIRLIGGAFLLYLGIDTIRAKPATKPAELSARGVFNAYGSTFLLTLTNPLTILSFTAMFAALGAGNTGGDYGKGMQVAAGVFLGSSSWWLILSSTVGFLRERITTRVLQIINYLSGGLIILFGILAIISILT